MVTDDFKKYYYVASMIGGTILVAIILGLFVVRPLTLTVMKMTTEKNTLSTQLKDLKDKQTALNNLKDQEDELEASAETVTNALPTDDQIGRLFIQLDSIAQATGGTLKSVSAASTSTGNAIAGVSAKEYSIPLEMPSYFALKQFITNAESALRLLSLDNLKIDVSNSGGLTVSLTAKAYSRGQ